MTPERYDLVAAYNAAYPESPIPSEPAQRHALRGYHAAMSGVTDDVTGSEGTLTVEFLPGGVPGPGEAERVGAVVATRWGSAPVLVLAPQVPLRAAWKAIVDRWPVRLSEVQGALDGLRTPAPAA